MLILLIMAAGVLVGLKWVPQKYTKWNGRLQLVCTLFLIFCMGISLGRRENFIQDLLSLGWQSFVLTLIPVVLSVAAVYTLSRLFLVKK